MSPNIALVPIAGFMEIPKGHGARRVDSPGRDSETECKDETAIVVRESDSGETDRRHKDSYYCNRDLYIQVQTVSTLYLSCFYYGDMTSAEAKNLLKHSKIGTYLVRNSSDPNYLYTLSVKTKRGPTSIRILYERGRFALDADGKAKLMMPTFPVLVELIDFYERLSLSKKSNSCRFLDRSGKDVNLPVTLETPRLNAVPGLKHMCRTTINRHLPAKQVSEMKDFLPRLHLADNVTLPKPILSYLKDYPYWH